MSCCLCDGWWIGWCTFPTVCKQPHLLQSRWLDSLLTWGVQYRTFCSSKVAIGIMPLPEQTGCPKHGAGAKLPGVWAALYTDISLWRQLDTSAQPSHMPGSAHGHCGLSLNLSTITPALAPSASQFWADSNPSPSVRVQQEPPVGDGGELKTGYFQACRWGEGRPTKSGQSPRGHSHP